MSSSSPLENSIKIVHKLLTKKPLVTLDEQYVLSYEEDILSIEDMIPYYRLLHYIDGYMPELIRKKSAVVINNTPLEELLKYRVGNIEEIDEFIDTHESLGISLKKEKLDCFIYGDKKDKVKNATQFHALEDSIYGKELFYTFEKKLNNITEVYYKFKLVIETPLKEFKPSCEEFIQIDIKAEINLIDYPLKFYIPTDIEFKDENDLEKCIYYTLGYIQNKVMEEKHDLLSFKFTILNIENININELEENSNITYVLVLSDIENNITTPFISLDKVFIDDKYDPINKLKKKMEKIAKESVPKMEKFYNHLVKRSSSYTYMYDIEILKTYTYVKGEKKQLYNASLEFKNDTATFNAAIEYSINSRYPNKMLPVHLDIDTIDTHNRMYDEVLSKVHKSFNKIFETDTKLKLEIYQNMKEYLQSFPFTKDEPLICFKIAAINVSVEVFSILIYFSINELSTLINKD